jgi:hypothetical protein
MADEPRDIKTLVDTAGKPRKPGKPNSGVVDVDFAGESAARLKFEDRIQATEDFDQLVYGLAEEIKAAKLRKATRETLLKQVAKKAGVSLESLREQPRRPGGGGPPGGGRASADHLPYEIDGHQIWLFDDEGRRPLCNFVATITEETLHDNGLEEEVLFRIEGRLHDGTPLQPVEIPASKYPALSWVASAWGARAVVYAGTSIKDHTRVAVQVLSPNIKRRTVYGHTGFRKIGGEWLYLHSGGAIGAEGHRTDIEVRAGEGHMKRYRFETDVGGDLGADIRSSLRLLDIAKEENPALGVVLLASVYRAPLGEAAVISVYAKLI